MKWKTNLEPSPLKKGNQRHRKVFAWLPKECDDGHTYWLTRIMCLEEVVEVEDWDDGPYGPYYNGTYLAWQPKRYYPIKK